jgi:hypothetical protein
MADGTEPPIFILSKDAFYDLFALPFAFEGGTAVMHGDFSRGILAYVIVVGIVYVVHAKQAEVATGFRRLMASRTGFLALLVFLLAYIAETRIAFEIAGYANGSIQQIAALNDQLSAANALIANDKVVAGQLEAKVNKSNTQIAQDAQELARLRNTDDSMITNLNERLEQSNDSAGKWLQRYTELVTQIAGKDFSDQFIRAQSEVDLFTFGAKQADAALAAYQACWDKREVPHPPMATRKEADNAHQQLNEAQKYFDHLDPQWKSRLASCIKK